MRLPKSVLNVADVASNHRTRYAIDCVHVERKGGSVRVAATDGCRLLVVKWPEESSAPLAGFEDADRPVEGFSAVIPRAELKLAMAGVQKPKKAKGQKNAPDAFVLLDETSCNGHVSLIAPREESVHRLEVKTNSAPFPNYDDVIPTYEILKQDSAKPQAVRVAIDGARLMSLLSAMLACTDGPFNANQPVIMEVPADPTRAIKLTRGQANGGVSATGVLMPMMVPLEGEGR